MTSNVRDFGAVGDGQADDTDAFLRAAEAVPASGGVLLITAGDGALLTCRRPSFMAAAKRHTKDFFFVFPWCRLREIGWLDLTPFCTRKTCL